MNKFSRIEFLLNLFLFNVKGYYTMSIVDMVRYNYICSYNEKTKKDEYVIIYSEGAESNPIFEINNNGKQIDIVKLSNLATIKPYVEETNEPIDFVTVPIKNQNYDLYQLMNDRKDRTKCNIVHNKNLDIYHYIDDTEDNISLEIHKTNMKSLQNGVYIKKIKNKESTEELVTIQQDKVYTDSIKTYTYPELRYMYGNPEILQYKNIIYKRNKYGLVDDVIGDYYYNYKDYDKTMPDNTMYSRSIYRVPMIYGINGLYTADMDEGNFNPTYCFMISDTADIDIQKNKIIALNREIKYIPNSEYERILQE